jgi:hypothetical protein
LFPDTFVCFAQGFPLFTSNLTGFSRTQTLTRIFELIPLFLTIQQEGADISLLIRVRLLWFLWALGCWPTLSGYWNYILIVLFPCSQVLVISFLILKGKLLIMCFLLIWKLSPHLTATLHKMRNCLSRHLCH